MDAMKQVNEQMIEMISAVPLLNGQSVKEFAGIAESDIKQLHAWACAFFEKGKLNEAELYFRQLVLLDSNNLDYILGLGAVLQRKKLYTLATDAYAIAHMIQQNDSRPMFYAGQCNFLERKYTKAKFCFENVVKQNYSPELVKMAKLFIESIDQGNTKEEVEND